MTIICHSHPMIRKGNAMLKKKARNRITLVYALILVPLLMYIFFIITPLIISILYSFSKWSGIGEKQFIGLQNYNKLIHDKNFWLAAKNTLVIALYAVLGQVGIALIVSFLMTNHKLKFRELHRTVIFFPVVMAPIVIGFIWKFIYNKDYGLLNALLKVIGREDWIKPWLDDPGIVVKSVSIPVVWQFIGLYMIILLGAVMSIPNEIFECAELDGANWRQKSVFITLPMIWDTLKIAIILCASGTMKIYDQIYVMTNGGPGRASSVLALYCYDMTFRIGNFGYGATISVSILVFGLLLAGLIQLLMGRRDNNI